MNSKDLQTIVVLDRYTSKYYKLEVPNWQDPLFEDIIVFSYDSDGKIIRSLGVMIGNKFSDIDRKGEYQNILRDKELKKFRHKQEEALQKFPLFKQEFKQNFPTSIPITARYHVFSGLWYFYFYAEERYNFSEFIKSFRAQLWAPFFFYQLSARDMIRLDPRADNMIGDFGGIIECKSYRPLEDVTMDDIYLQNLEGRDLERLKWLHGRFKASLAYESELYKSESKLFPKKWTTVKRNGEEATVKKINIITRLIDLQLDDDRRAQIHLDDRNKLYSTS